MRKYGLPILALMITVLAFFLPEYLSRHDDTHLLNQLHIISQDSSENLSQWSHLSIAEKLILIRSGNVQRVSLPRDTVSDIQCVLKSGSLTPLSEELQDSSADDIEAQTMELWLQRMIQSYSEVYKLQKAGAVPPFWPEGSIISLKRHSQSLYIDRETQVSFPVYSLELLCPPYDLHLTVDSQSGKILSAAIAWTRNNIPKWNHLRFSVWKDYWRMDAVNLDLMDTVFQDLLFSARDNEQTVTREFIFTYDNQNLSIPMTRRDYSSACTALFWNCDPQEFGGWTPMDNLLVSSDDQYH